MRTCILAARYGTRVPKEVQIRLLTTSEKALAVLDLRGSCYDGTRLGAKD